VRNTYATFDLPAWRRRMGWKQDRAAHELGVELSTYRRAEYVCADTPGRPVKLSLIHLCQLIEVDPPADWWQPPPLVETVGQQDMKPPALKLTPAKVKKIRAAKGVAKEIGEWYGISAQTVRAIKARKSWKHVE
jgi:DNA-binding XRE family transcriptional regulator